MNSKLILIVLDANTWIAERLLKSALGAALLYSIHQLGSTILLPEVTEREIMTRIVDEGERAVQRIEGGLLTLQTLTGQRPKYHLPETGEFIEITKKMFNELGDLILRVPLKMDHFGSALKRVIEKRPPNRTKEQLRASLFWEALKEVSLSNEIHLISNDVCFYQDNDLKKGLDHQLISEIKEINGRIIAYENMGLYLKAIEQGISPPLYDDLALAIRDVISDELRSYGEERGFTVGNLLVFDLVAFITEEKDILAIIFELNYEVCDLHEPEEDKFDGATFLIMGNCTYNIQSNIISDVNFDRLECRDVHDEIIPGSSTTFVRLESAIYGTTYVSNRLGGSIGDI